MNKISQLFLYSLLSTIFIISSSQAQLHISLGPAIGYVMPASDFQGSTADYYNGTKYGMTSGFDFGAMGKLGLGPLNFNLALLYAPLSSSGSVPDPGANSTVNIKMHLFTIAVGTQYGFISIPMAPIKPYLGVDLLLTTISGSFQFQNTQKVNTDSHDLNSATRVGLGFGAGIEVQVLATSLDISLKYNLINLFSKRYEGSSASDRTQAYLYLNDDKDPNYSSVDPNHPIGSSRNIATLQLQLGIMFGL